MRIDRVPIFLQVAARIAHHVRIFAQDQRLAERPVGRVIDELGGGVVHRRVDVREIVGVMLEPPVPRAPAEIADEPRRIALLRGGRGGSEVRADPGLVAERPEDDRGVVLVALDHVGDARDVRGLPRGIEAELIRPTLLGMLVGEVHIGVALDIGLVHDIQAIAVGELVEPWVVGVMRGADRVDVGALHQLDVALHRFERDDVEGLGIMLVAVDAADRDRPAVDGDEPVLDRYAAKADPAIGRLHDRAFRVVELDQQHVEIGRLGGPRLHLRDRRRDRDGAFGGGGGNRGRLFRDHTLAIEQHDPRAGRRLGRGHREIDRELAVAIALVEPGMDEEIADPGLGRRHQKHFALDARNAPEILVLEIASVGPAIDLDRDRVVAGLEIAADIEFGRQLAVLGIADLGAVDPDVIGRARGTDMQDHVAARPARRDLDIATV